MHHAVCGHSVFLGSRLTHMGYVDGRQDLVRLAE